MTKTLCGFIFVITVDLTISFFFLITGSINIHNCSSDTRLPAWMIILGAWYFVYRGTSQLSEYFYPENTPFYPFLFSRGMEFGIVVLAILGLIWTCQIIGKANYECNFLLLWTSFSFSLSLLLGLTIGFFIAIGFLIQQYYKLKRENVTSQQNE